MTENDNTGVEGHFKERIRAMKSKKKMTTTALAVALAVLLLIGGGTFAYLQSTTGDVKNNFKTNKVMVELSETGDGQYDIIPGTEQSKDPKVTVNNTVGAYVYVEVTDTTQGLVEYSIADGWTPLDGFEGVYYREVAKSTDPQVFSVLKDDKVSYSTALENSDMLNTDGSLKAGVELTFKAHAIQKAGFDSAVAAYKQIPTEAATTEEITKAIANGKAVKLADDATNVSVPIENLTDKNVSIDLNGKTLTITGRNTEIGNGESLTLENGTVDWNVNDRVAIAMNTGSDVTLKNITTDMNGKSILINPGTDVADLDIIDSTLTTTDFYVISTNAANNLTGKSVDINIQNSTLKTLCAGKDDAGVLFNVPGTLNIEKSTIQGDRQAVIVRCGTATIKDSKLICTGETASANWDKYIAEDDKGMWGSGNEVPVATLVVGNRSNANVYPYDASCTLSNTTLTLGDGNTGRTLVYAAAYNGHTTTISGVDAAQITQSKDAISTITIK